MPQFRDESKTLRPPMNSDVLTWGVCTTCGVTQGVGERDISKVHASVQPEDVYTNTFFP